MIRWISDNISGSGIAVFIGMVFIVSLLTLKTREDYKHKDEMRNNQLIEIKGYIRSSDLTCMQKILVQEK